MDEKKNLKDTSNTSVAVTAEVLQEPIQAGIIGGAGYTGGELIRILLNHPHAEISFAFSKSNAGKYIHEIHGDLIGETNLQFSDTTVSLFEESTLSDSNVLFLCMGYGESQKFLEENNINDKIKLIDLSQDFRLNRKSEIGNRKFVYGLPELNKEKIRQAQNIANPGCFATAIQLGLLPLAKAGLLKEVYTTGITGSTGAGQGLSQTSHFSWRANNIQAYKTLTHQHLNEIYQSLNQLQSSFPGFLSVPDGGSAGENEIGVRFVPWRGDFTRGIFVSSQLTCTISEKGLNDLYQEFYNDHPFTFLSKEPISLKQVVNTNKCVIQVDKAGSRVVVHSAIDNLLKGASGQAVQNMNLMFGLNETAGLKFKANYF
jgi:N-acetyl-gamma-glutamyl-phosphate reductase